MKLDPEHTYRDDGGNVYIRVFIDGSPRTKKASELRAGERLVIQTARGFFASSPIRYVHRARAKGYYVAELENGEMNALGHGSGDKWFFPAESPKVTAKES